MTLLELVDLIDKQKWLKPASERVHDAVGSVYSLGGERAQGVRNFLHGVWLGHPVHAMMTDVPVGAWTAALVLDAVDTSGSGPGAAKMADTAIGVGLAGGVASAVAGLADWRHVYGRPQRVGFVHGTLNLVALILYTASLLSRRSGNRGLGKGLAGVGYGVVTVSGYLGGDLAYNDRIGMNHTQAGSLPKKFTPVMADADLEEGVLTRAEAKGAEVLLYRRDGQIYAVDNICSHLGCGLNKGQLVGDDVVECPCHGSRFSLATGSVVAGPAVYPLPVLETRVRSGQVEVRVSNHPVRRPNPLGQ